MSDRPILTDEHEAFRRTVRSFIEKEVAPHHAQWEQDGQVSREVWTKAGAQEAIDDEIPVVFKDVGMDEATMDGMHVDDGDELYVWTSGPLDEATYVALGMGFGQDLASHKHPGVGPVVTLDSKGVGLVAVTDDGDPPHDPSIPRKAHFPGRRSMGI